MHILVSFKDLLDSWRESAAAPRTARTYAVRLPVDDAAQLAALADMFPGRAPEQLISELLAVALKELAAAMPYVAGKRVISTDEHGDPVYEDVGPTPRFIELAVRLVDGVSDLVRIELGHGVEGGHRVPQVPERRFFFFGRGARRAAAAVRARR